MRPLKWHEGVLAVLDFETTGVDVTKDRAIQVALIFEVPGGYTLPSSYVRYVNPGEEALARMPVEAIMAHGIYPDTITRHGVDSEQAFIQIGTLLYGAEILSIPLLAYNLPFDWRLLHHELARHNLPAPGKLILVDPLLLDHHLDKYRRGSRKLVDVAKHYGITLANAHDAYHDCVATAECFRAMLKQHPGLESYLPEELYEYQKRWFEVWKQDRNRYWASQGDARKIDYSWPGIEEELV